MKIEKFEDIIAWQKSKILALDIYRSFKSCKDFSFRGQVERAAISVSNNIAEGYERQGNKEFSKFLYIAKGSCAEVRSMLYIAMDLQYISSEKFDKIYKSSLEVSKMLSGFIKCLR